MKRYLGLPPLRIIAKDAAEAEELKAELNPLEAIKKRMAIKWLCWEYGMSGVDAAACVERWPDHDKASEAVNVAEFVCDVCWGEIA